MPIQIRTVDGERVPVVICDQCQQEITSAENGKIISRAIDMAEPRFVHKECSAAFSAAQAYVPESMELTAFVNRLSELEDNE